MRLGFFGRVIVTTLTFLAIPYVVSGVHVTGIWAAFLGAICLLIFNFTVKPLLIILTLPLTILTLGLFLFIVNALVFYLLAAFVPGIMIDSFGASLLASLVMTVVSWFLNLSLNDTEGRRVIVVSGGKNDRNTRDLN